MLIKEQMIQLINETFGFLVYNFKFLRIRDRDLLFLWLITSTEVIGHCKLDYGLLTSLPSVVDMDHKSFMRITQLECSPLN